MTHIKSKVSTHLYWCARLTLPKALSTHFSTSQKLLDALRAVSPAMFGNAVLGYSGGHPILTYEADTMSAADAWNKFMSKELEGFCERLLKGAPE